MSRVGWDYGFRSGCCFAPIRLGKKRVKNSKLSVAIWVCTKCKKRDIQIVDVTGKGPASSRENGTYRTYFIPENDDDFREEGDG